jgi:hypothetical protein
VRGFEEQPEERYLDMSGEELARLILTLLIDEALRRRLAEYLPPQPIQRLEEFGVAGAGVVPLGHALGGIGQEVGGVELEDGVLAEQG